MTNPTTPTDMQVLLWKRNPLNAYLALWDGPPATLGQPDYPPRPASQPATLSIHWQPMQSALETSIMYQSLFLGFLECAFPLRQAEALAYIEARRLLNGKGF